MANETLNIGGSPADSFTTITSLVGGDYIVSWRSSHASISFQRFNIIGNAVTPVLQNSIPSGTTLSHVPNVISTPDGGYIISQYYDNGSRGFSYSVYSSQNLLISGPRLVGEAGWSYASEAGSSNTAYANGYFMSASHSEAGGTGGGFSGGAWDVNFHLKDLNGLTIFSGKVTTSNFGVQVNPDIVPLSDGKNVLITWSDGSGNLDSSEFGIYARVFSTDSRSFITNPFLINEGTLGSQGGWNGSVSTVSLPNGGFASFWIEDVNAGVYGSTISQGRIEGRFFVANGGTYQPSGNDFAISTGAVGNQNFVRASVTPDGKILVVFSVVAPSGGATLYGKVLGSNGSVIKNDFVISTSADDLSGPDIAWLPDGSAVAVWTNDNAATIVAGDRAVLSQIIPASTFSPNTAPVITSDSGGPAAVLVIAENATAATIVAANDPDVNASLSYSIIGGADAALFQINSATGALSFKAAPNFEVPGDSGANNIYDVIVQVSDGTLTDTQALAVTVTNANEAPVITSNSGGATAAVNVAENTTAVTTVTANDVDASTTLSYSISGGADAARFSINAATGALSFRAAPNFEAPTDVGANNLYDVVVQVSDGGLTDTQAITVYVTNVPETSNIFANPGPAVIANFNAASGWSSQDQFPRHVADMNGDGYADVVGFGFAGTFVSYGSALGTFSGATLVLSNFGQTAGWTSDNQFHREVVDVNGDGRADIVGFGQAGTLVSLARSDGSFADPILGVANFGVSQGWTTQDGFARTLGDVNGDGFVDIVGFGAAGTLVSLGNGNGTFQQVRTGIANFGVSQGWSSDNRYHRAVADVTGDGRDDLIGFGIGGTFVAVSRGDGTFNSAQLVLNDFGANQGWSSDDKFSRLLADVNGDAVADIVGFGIAGTLISFGKGDGTFSDASFDLANFGANQGWNSDNAYHRTIADMNNDGLADIVGFGIAGVLVGLNDGTILL